MPRQLAAAAAAALTLIGAGAVAAPARADAMMSEQAPSRVITVPRDKSLSFRLDEPASKIVVAQPDIAEVVATTDRSFYVRGLDVGSTNLLVYGPGGRLMQVIDVRVGVDAADLQRDLAVVLPGEHIKVQNLGEGVLLSGDVSNPGVAIRATTIAQRFSPDGVTSMLRVGGSQVVLEVRILEATRSTSRDTGVGLEIGNGSFDFQVGANVVGHPIIPAGGQFPLVGLVGADPPQGALNIVGAIGHTSVDAQLAALEQKGLIRTLARPNLVALSGEKASFLAGGEFPFPVPSGLGQISIEFRQYGVKLEFTPTVQDDGKIRMVVAPEVSELDQANTVRIDNVTVPALTIRRTATTVELRDGESLTIGGLFQHGYTNQLNQIPGLSEIPILSALFRSTRFQRNETELLIIVTPHIVTQGDIDASKNKTLSGAEPSAMDLLLNGKALDKAIANDLRGPIDAPAPPPAAAQAKAQTAPVPMPAQALRGQIAPSVPAAAVTEAPTVPASGR
ncbi:MAG TPA: type II and III secretion system protein family protein [Phenylobacterium sp.]|nr:type II and III secretion system protein family protein [Phenylobacterium sp.]